MAKYYGASKATKVYPKRTKKTTFGIELDKDQAYDAMLAIAGYLKSDESDDKRLIITAFKSKANKAGMIPMTFIAGKNKN